MATAAHVGAAVVGSFHELCYFFVVAFFYCAMYGIWHWRRKHGDWIAADHEAITANSTFPLYCMTLMELLILKILNCPRFKLSVKQH